VLVAENRIWHLLQMRIEKESQLEILGRDVEGT
jgi:hypothetical protein